jgi:hypothetical protein
MYVPFSVFCVLFVCKCVVLLPAGVNPIAVIYIYIKNTAAPMNTCVSNFVGLFFYLNKLDYNPCFTFRYFTGYVQRSCSDYRHISMTWVLRSVDMSLFRGNCGAYFPSGSSCSACRMWLRKLETLAVCMWCFRIIWGCSFCSTAGRFLEYWLHSGWQLPFFLLLRN